MAEKNLSKGGKEVLIKSTLASIPTNYMSLFHALALVIEKLAKIQRNFLWDAADGARKFHLVRWEVVTSPKNGEGWELKI